MRRRFTASIRGLGLNLSPSKEGTFDVYMGALGSNRRTRLLGSSAAPVAGERAARVWQILDDEKKRTQ